CATIAEAKMAAQAGVSDLLLAYQPVGPNVCRVIELMKQFPQTKFLVVCDDAGAIRELSSGLQRHPSAIRKEHETKDDLEVLLDLDIGQHRTGVSTGPEATELYQVIASSPRLKSGGLHAYDGHISTRDPVERKLACDSAFAAVVDFRQQLLSRGLPVSRVVA